jgi:3-hydroxyisobutyrate dehydrogenase-like beta-hydroxyacid dehydrogenase
VATEIRWNGGQMNVGFIGVGQLGAPMARRIRESGLPLAIWARRPESLVPFEGVAVAESPAELGAASDVVGVCVFSDSDVEDVLLRRDGVLAGMSPGGVVVIHSTVDPRTCARVAEAAAVGQVSVVDAPVSGSAELAEEGQLLVMTGGEEDDVRRCRPVLESFGKPIVHVGPLGSGLVAKAINNLLLAAHMTLAIDAYDFARDLGLDRAALGQVLAHGSGGSKAATIVAGLGFDADYMRRASAPYFIKDMAVMQEIADDRGVSQPGSLLGLARQALD